MKEKLVEYLNTELHYTEVGMKNETSLIRIENILWYARQRGLGATQFANALGMPFEEVEAIFEEYVNKIEVLKNEVCRLRLYGV